MALFDTHNLLHAVDKEIVERESKIYDLLSMVDQTKKDLKMSGWVHMPKTSEEYLYYSMDCGNYEAFAHIDRFKFWFDGRNSARKTMSIKWIS